MKSCGCFWRDNYKGGAYSGAEILVGEECQAVIPDFKPCSAREDRDHPDKDFLLWSPNSFQDSECVSQGNLLFVNHVFFSVDKYEVTAVNMYGFNKEQALGMLFWHKHLPQ